METQIINGKKIRDDILEQVKEEVAHLPFQPIFCDVLVGEDKVSEQYVNMKARTAEKVGIHFHNAHFPATIKTEELIEEIKKINQIPNIAGIIVQLPLPEHLDKEKIFSAIDPMLDVDSLGKVASDKFYSGDISIGYPTALSCMQILDSLHIDLKDKNIVVVGQGMLVGKPVAHLLNLRNLNVKVVIKETLNKEEIIKLADVLISGTGAGQIIKGDSIKEGVVIIDAGTSESKGGIVGDVDLESVRGVASYVSPVPGGVGPVTVAMLLKNVLQVAKTLK